MEPMLQIRPNLGAADSVKNACFINHCFWISLRLISTSQMDQLYERAQSDIDALLEIDKAARADLDDMIRRSEVRQRGSGLLQRANTE